MARDAKKLGRRPACMSIKGMPETGGAAGSSRDAGCNITETHQYQFGVRQLVRAGRGVSRHGVSHYFMKLSLGPY